jgi:hypothetical protein
METKEEGFWVTEMFSGVTIFQPNEEKIKCKICDSPLPGCLEWGFRNGHATCRNCGAGYQCLVRDDKGKLLNEEPICLVDKNLMPLYQSAWKSRKNEDEYKEKIKEINSKSDKP